MNSRLSAVIAVLLAGWTALPSHSQPTDPTPAAKAVLPPLPAEAAPAASPRRDAPKARDLPTLITRYFDGQIGRRLYIQVDKPLYKPGETIWFKTWDVQARSLNGASSPAITVELVSPKGATVLKKRLQVSNGVADNDFELPAEAQGGEYTLRAISADGQRVERGVIVSAYEAPRLKKKLEFVKKAYGAGDQVSATVEVKRPTGEALGGKLLNAVITVDGVELPRVKVTTAADGTALVKFDLPKNIAAGDGLLTLLVEDGGITESISKSIPLVLKKLAVGFFPEGGALVNGLQSRLYFEVKTPLGKPADVDGRIVDDLGNAVATFSTYKNGLGRIDFTPATGRSYRAEITRPVGVTEHYALPLANDQGCVLRSFDDLDGRAAALRVAIRCSEAQKVIVAATLRENLLDVAAVDAGTTPAVVYLKSKDDALQQASGAARVTLFNQELQPLAERLVFRNRRARLDVSIEPDKKAYTPRGQVALQITTKDPSGKVVPAELALAVVDDTVVSFADDKTAHLLSRLLLEAELPGKIEEPNFYLDLTEDKSALALDLLMGTRGYRRFEWTMVTTPPQAKTEFRMLERMAMQRIEKKGEPELRQRVDNVPPRPAAAPAKVLQAPAAPAALAPPPPPAEAQPALAAKPMPKRDQGFADAIQPGRAQGNVVAGKLEIAREQDQKPIAEDKDFARAEGKMKRAAIAQPEAWAPVRVFPVPAFQPNYAGPRDDFRETVFWAPSVKTDAQGKAKVSFVLSDAVTSFRVFGEGIGQGVAGRSEKVFKSSLPFSLAVKLPLEVSAGDQPLIPVTLSNDQDQALNVALDANFGALLLPGKSPGKGGKLAAGQRSSLFFPLDVTGVRGESKVRLAASAGGLNDEVVRNIPVVPVGFPQLIEKSGLIKGEVKHELDLQRAGKGSVQATLKVYTSPLSTMMSGLEGMLREPNGCFEQTSSTNYPNVMILHYLKQHDVADPALLEKSGKLLDSGYKKLAGYESPKKGYEWFGGDPGHEALTAYGLLQFADMKEVYGTVDPAMVARTSAWLKSRRDGKGGYLRDAKALDSFGRAAPEVTNAYITWALTLAGETGLEREIAQSQQLAETSNDAYLLALTSATLLQRKAGTPPSKAAAAAAAKLAKMQAASGAWSNADHSITRSGGSNLHIETTALAILALLQADGYQEEIRKGITWLQNNRSGFGQWGATQATVLALKAMTAYDAASRIAPRAGAVQLLLDGKVVREVAYEAGRREPILITDIDDLLPPGKHQLVLRSKSGDPLPYSLAVEYRTTEPASSRAAVVDLTTRLGKSTLKMGETVRLDAVISNKTQTGQPMTLARLGLPAGLTFQNWQLKELREKGQIAFFETRAREVILYFRDLKPGDVKKLGIDLVASVPGKYTGPASSAYLYYNDTDKSWAAPLVVNITP